MLGYGDVERRRLLIMVERLHRQGCSEREIEAALREASGYSTVHGLQPGRRRLDDVLMRLTPLRIWG